MHQSASFSKPRHRLSMLEVANRAEPAFEENKRSYKFKRNSSIEGVSKRESNRQSQLNKIIGLAFSKQKSKRSFKSDKENRQSTGTIADSTLSNNSAAIIMNSSSLISAVSPNSPQSLQLTTKSKFFPAGKEETPCSDISSLQRQFQLIIEEPVKPKERKLSRDRFMFIEKLGEGSYSEVFLVREKVCKTLFALKIVKRHHFKQPKELERFISQIKIQLFCDHPNIVKSYGLFSDQGHLYILQEYAGRQNLYSLIQKEKNKIPLCEISDLIGQLCNAVGYLHKHNIIHRDLKPQNILIGPGRIVKLTDFGWSVYNPDHQLRSTFCGTPFYFSPELLSAQKYDQSVDIWAIGVMSYEILTGSNPFGIESFDDLKKIVSEQAKLELIKDKNAREFVTRLIRKERLLRTSISDVLDHPFLQLRKLTV